MTWRIGGMYVLANGHQSDVCHTADVAVCFIELHWFYISGTNCTGGQSCDWETQENDCDGVFLQPSAHFCSCLPFSAVSAFVCVSASVCLCLPCLLVSASVSEMDYHISDSIISTPFPQSSFHCLQLSSIISICFLVNYFYLIIYNP